MGGSADNLWPAERVALRFSHCEALTFAFSVARHTGHTHTGHDGFQVRDAQQCVGAVRDRF